MTFQSIFTFKFIVLYKNKKKNQTDHLERYQPFLIVRNYSWIINATLANIVVGIVTNKWIIKLLKQTWHHEKLALLVYDLRGFKSSIFNQVTFCSLGVALFMWFPCNVLFLSQVLSASIIVCCFWMHSLYQL